MKYNINGEKIFNVGFRLNNFNSVIKQVKKRYKNVIFVIKKSISNILIVSKFIEKIKK